jgi:Response regulators consisting of a CheY-like receiver domain and a winged-helix DNA-binding domain
MATILVVDDNEDILHLLQLILLSRGFEVQTTTKGEETFELVNIFQPVLIFLDINLAGMDGRDISRQLKTNEETKHIPIILFSSNIIKGTTLKESLADEFIAKPFDVHELLVKVNNLTGNAGIAESIIA